MCIRDRSYSRIPNKIISINEWYETPYLKFKLVKNTAPLDITLDNIVINLKTIDETVNEIKSTLSVDFDTELSTMMIITKKGYNLNGTVNFLNRSVEELQAKRKIDKSIVDKNTVDFIKTNLKKAKAKLDSTSAVFNSCLLYTSRCV